MTKLEEAWGKTAVYLFEKEKGICISSFPDNNIVAFDVLLTDSIHIGIMRASDFAKDLEEMLNRIEKNFEMIADRIEIYAAGVGYKYRNAIVYETSLERGQNLKAAMRLLFELEGKDKILAGQVEAYGLKVLKAMGYKV